MSGEAPREQSLLTGVFFPWGPMGRGFAYSLLDRSDHPVWIMFLRLFEYALGSVALHRLPFGVVIAVWVSLVVADTLIVRALVGRRLTLPRPSFREYFHSLSLTSGALFGPIVIYFGLSTLNSIFAGNFDVPRNHPNAVLGAALYVLLVAICLPLGVYATVVSWRAGKRFWRH